MNVVIEKNVDAKMRDGTVLRADIYRPESEGSFPVLVQRTPYNKEFWPFTAAGLDPVRAAAQGYIVVIQDVRGRWASDGDSFFLYRNEFEDGHDTIEWAATLASSNGKVGAYGISYMGAAAWNAAATSPPSLKALAPFTAPSRFSTHMWQGGVLNLGMLVSWSLAGIGLSQILRTEVGKPDFIESFTRLIADIDNYEEIVREMPIERLSAARPDSELLGFFFELLKHPGENEFNATVLIEDRYSGVKAPAMIVAGWHDLLLEEDLRHFTQMKASAGTEEAREKTRIIIGPWAHAAFANVVGQLDFGLRASGLMLDLTGDLTALNLRWFDQRLKGIDNGLDQDPPIKIFVQGINLWRFENEWPLARAVEQDWFLGPIGTLSTETPTQESSDDFIYDPQDPCPTLGGPLLMPAQYTRGPVDQTPILSRSDVLSYTSEVLQQDIEVTGPISLTLHAATDGPDTDWVVKLCDVHPDGRSFNMSDGVLRASYRQGLKERVLLEPGKPEVFEIALHATSNVFLAGHRIQLIVTSSDFPRYDRNPNTGESSIEAVVTRPAKQTILHSAAHLSKLILPVIPADG